MNIKKSVSRIIFAIFLVASAGLVRAERGIDLTTLVSCEDELAQTEEKLTQALQELDDLSLLASVPAGTQVDGVDYFELLQQCQTEVYSLARKKLFLSQQISAIRSAMMNL